MSKDYRRIGQEVSDSCRQAINQINRELEPILRKYSSYSSVTSKVHEIQNRLRRAERITREFYDRCNDISKNLKKAAEMYVEQDKREKEIINKTGKISLDTASGIVISNISKNISKAFDNAGDVIKNGAEAISDGVISVIGGIGKKIDAAYSSIKSSVSNAVDSVKVSIGEFTGKTVNTVVTPIIEMPDHSDIIEMPDHSDIIEVPDHSDIIEVPDQSHIIEVPDISHMIEVPGPPELPELPEIPLEEIPDHSDIIEFPDLSDIIEMPEIPHIIEVPDYSDIIEIPDLSDIVEFPDLSDIVEVPETSVTPPVTISPVMTNNEVSSGVDKIDKDVEDLMKTIEEKKREEDRRRAIDAYEKYKSGEKIADNLDFKQVKDSDMANQANKLKKEVYQNYSDKGVRSTVNVSLVEYEIEGLLGEIKAASSNKVIPEGFVGFTKKKRFNAFEADKCGRISKQGFLRNGDTEVKLLSHIDELIEKSLQHIPQGDIKGTVNLHTRLEPCASCLGVIRQFCERYPNIKVNVTWEIDYLQ